MQALDLAKLQEEKFLELCKYQCSSFTQPNNYTTTNNSVLPSSYNPPLLPKPPSIVPLKRLSALEL